MKYAGAYAGDEAITCSPSMTLEAMKGLQEVVDSRSVDLRANLYLR